MTDRPILFSASMVIALLAGRKTQTRRLASVKSGVALGDIKEWVEQKGGVRRGVFARDQIAEPRIAVGDRLWVREAWRTAVAYDDLSPSEMGGEEPIIYMAGGFCETRGWPKPRAAGRLRVGMHMPRWASRLTLAVTEVRVQRLQDISADDALDEGIGIQRCGCEVCATSSTLCPADQSTVIMAYAELWDSLNADRAPWDSNPWVAAYTFAVHHGNIDQIINQKGATT